MKTTLNEDIDRLGATAMRIADERNALAEGSAEPHSTQWMRPDL